MTNTLLKIGKRGALSLHYVLWSGFDGWLTTAAQRDLGQAAAGMRADMRVITSLNRARFQSFTASTGWKTNCFTDL